MDNAYFRQPPSPRSLQLSPPTRLSAAAAVRASFGPSLSAGRQLVLLLPHSHTPKPPICAGAVRLQKSCAMTGLDSAPSLSSIPLHAHLTLLITCFSTRARNSSLESSRESSAASLSFGVWRYGMTVYGWSSQRAAQTMRAVPTGGRYH